MWAGLGLSRLEAGGLAWGTSMEVRCAGRTELSANSSVVHDGIHCVGRQMWHELSATGGAMQNGSF